jgi:hypothetical protein
VVVGAASGMLGLLDYLDGVQHRAPLDIVIETKRRSNNRPKAYGIYALLWAWLHPETHAPRDEGR